MQKSLVVVLAALLAVCALNASARAALTNRWAFEEPDGTAAPQVQDSVGGNHGTFQNMDDTNRSTSVPNGFIGSTRSLSFAGGPVPAEKVGLASQISLATNANWSVATWYKGTDSGVNNVSGFNFGSTLLGRDNNDIFANFVIRNGKASFLHWNGGWQFLSSTVDVNDDAWHHIALVHRSDQTADIYVDGTLQATGSVPYVIFAYRIDNMMLGYSGRYTQGTLDDARVYNHSLSNLEIKELLPEPSALSLLACGGLLISRRRKPINV